MYSLQIPNTSGPRNERALSYEQPHANAKPKPKTPKRWRCEHGFWFEEGQRQICPHCPQSKKEQPADADGKNKLRAVLAAHVAGKQSCDEIIVYARDVLDTILTPITIKSMRGPLIRFKMLAKESGKYVVTDYGRSWLVNPPKYKRPQKRT